MGFLKNIKFAQFATQKGSRPTMPPTSFQPNPSVPPATPPSPTPPVQNTNPSYMVTGESPPGGKKGILKIVGIIATVIIVLIVAMGVVLATRIWDPLWNPFRPKPEKVLENMMAKMLENKTGHTKITFEMSVIDTKYRGGTKISALIEGDGDVTDKTNPKWSFDFKLSASPSGEALSKLSFNISVKGKTVATGKDNTMYFQLSDLNVDSLMGEEVAVFDGIKGKWLKIDKDIINKLDEAGDDVGDAQALNAGMTNEIQEALFKNGIFVVSKQLNDEVMEGKPVYHYLASVDKDKLVSVISDLMQPALEEKLKNQPTSGKIGADAIALVAKGIMKGMIDEFSKVIGDLEADLYIGKNDYMLYGVNFEKSIDLSKISKAISGEIEIKINLENSEFGKVVSVTEPKESIPLDEILAPFIEEEKARQKVGVVKNEMSKIRSSATIINATTKSYYSLCSRGAINGLEKTQGVSLQKSNDNIVSQGATKPVCFSSAMSYCLSTKIGETEICFGINGGIGRGKCISATTKCVKTYGGVTPLAPITY